MRIGMVAGEASGDLLGAGLMQALRHLFPEAVFEGVGGPKMTALGFNSLYPQDRLAVMGLVEPLRRLPELLSIRNGLKRHFTDNPPVVFIGIDSPDFNLNLERHLRGNSVKTVHYVSPTVWAWRQKRIHTIAAAVDLMLTLFPFEQRIYEQHGVPVSFVGHPLADDIPLNVDQSAARAQLALTEWIGNRRVVALMPGSRAGEVKRMAGVFLDTAKQLLAKDHRLCFLIPSASALRHEQLTQILSLRQDQLPVKLISGESHAVMAAADVVLMASGTTSLEAMLLKKPMVIAYKLAPLSYALLKRLIKVQHIGLPNLLAGQTLAPEFIQDGAEPVALARALNDFLFDAERVEQLQRVFTEQHLILRRDASAQAAQAIAALIQ